MNFVALDVETANPDLSSICQIGVVEFTHGRVADKWSTLVDPEDYFHGANVSVHGISESAVRGQPTWPQIQRQLESRIRDRVVVCHTGFDCASLRQAWEKYRLLPVTCRWLDSALVVRRTWPEFSRSGYGLANVAEFLGIEFGHHDALEDARAAGEILLRAIETSGVALEDWFLKVTQPLSPRIRTLINRDGDPGGPLRGHVVVFTGALSIGREEAAGIAAAAGCEVTANVTRKTTLLVVGDCDLSRLAGHEKSSKHRKAEELILNGQEIRILGESDFVALLGLSQASAANEEGS